MIEAVSSIATDPQNQTLDYVLKHVYPVEYPQTAKSTRKKLRQIVNRWNATMKPCPVAQIDRQKLIEYRNQSLANGLAPSTINGHIRAVVTLARSAGYPLSATRLKLTESQIPKPTPTLDELSRVWRMTGSATWPITRKSNGRAVWCGITPAMWWRALYMLAFSTGLRRADLFGLKWSEVESDRISTVNRKTGKPQYLPIPIPLRPWLELLRKQGEETVLGRNDRQKQLDREVANFGKLVNAKNVGLQALRRAAARAYEKAHPGCGRLILNHATTVTERSYLDVYDTLSIAAANLEYPTEFLCPVNHLLAESFQPIGDQAAPLPMIIPQSPAREFSLESPKAADSVSAWDQMSRPVDQRTFQAADSLLTNPDAWEFV